MTPSQPKTEALRALYWREEILQVMFWLRGEGFGDVVDPTLLERFLGVDAAIGLKYLDRLVEEGYLLRRGERYELSATGLEEGKKIFAEEFADFTKPAHGECGPDCWCHADPDEAEACTAERVNHLHDFRHFHE